VVLVRYVFTGEISTPFERLLSTIEERCKTASNCPHAAPMNPAIDMINKQFRNYILKSETVCYHLIARNLTRTLAYPLLGTSEINK